MMAVVLRQFARLSLNSAKNSHFQQRLPLLVPSTSSVQNLNVRFESGPVGRPRGCGRPLREGEIPPEPNKYGWRPILPADGKYTIKPLPIQRLGGRDPETGRVVVETIGGGNKKKFRWVDTFRYAPKGGPPLEERVIAIRYDPLRTAKIALVASEDHPRWIIATHGIKEGDIIRTFSEIPRIPVRPKDGDAHPLGALPAGTMIHCLENLPGKGADICMAAGTSAILLRKVGNRCIVQLPSKQEISVSEECMAVVGRVSNPDHGKIPIGSPNKSRWLGKRPRSGLWHRKDGYLGRKIKPPKPIRVITGKEEKEELRIRLTLPEFPIKERKKPAFQIQDIKTTKIERI